MVATQDDHAEDVVYLLPSVPYEYDHPEGTGKAESPFSSIWYCGIGMHRVADIKRCNVGKATFVKNLQELRDSNAIPTKKRPNPKQRKKRKAQAIKGSTDPASSLHPLTTSTTTTDSATPDRKGKSKHRDESGKRTKRRF